MTPEKFSIIQYQQLSGITCPACGFSTQAGAAMASFKPAYVIIDGVRTDVLQLVCTRCQYGNGLEWLMATAT